MGDLGGSGLEHPPLVRLSDQATHQPLHWKVSQFGETQMSLYTEGRDHLKEVGGSVIFLQQRRCSRLSNIFPSGKSASQLRWPARTLSASSLTSVHCQVV